MCIYIEVVFIKFLFHRVQKTKNFIKFSTTLVIMFWNTDKFWYKFNSPQVKQNLIYIKRNLVKQDA